MINWHCYSKPAVKAVGARRGYWQYVGPIAGNVVDPAGLARDIYANLISMGVDVDSVKVKQTTPHAVEFIYPVNS